MPKFLRIQEGWLTVGLLALLLFSVTLSVQHAQWSDGLSVLTPITLIGLLTGVILAKINRVPRFLLDLIGLQIGLITVLVATVSLMRDPRLGTVQERIQDLLARTSTWIGVAIRQDMSDDLVVFILSLAIVAWVLAYSSAYFVFRSRQLWWALVPNGVALLINLSYSIVNINGYIIVFMFSALLLMIRFNLLTKEERWQRERVNYSPGLTWAFLWTGSSVSVALALSMWFVPTTSVNSTLNGMWEQVNQPWVDFQTSMSRLWSQLPGNASIGGYSSFSKSFTMGGALNLSDSVALVVKSNEGLYLRATTYDQYNGIGWENTAEDTFHVPDLSPRLHLEEGQALVSPDLARTEVTYTVQILNPKKDILFTSLRPVSLDLPSRLEISWRDINETYDVDELYSAGGNTDTLPLELRSIIVLLRDAQYELHDKFKTEAGDSGFVLLNNSSKGELIRDQIDELLKRGVSLELLVEDLPGFRISVIARGQVPVYDDISAMRAVNPIQKNDQYEAVSSISRATADELQSASANYENEGWLTRYRALPANVSREVGELAASIVYEAEATNPYEQARAIEAYLRDNYAYNTNIPTPPSGTDPVEWFLFQNKQGYCTYYAASMVVMLRSLGIAARLSTGYAPGNYDSAAKVYVVTEARAHAWPEVYFPGYGWINFEPTPSEAIVTRETAESSFIPQPTPAAASDEQPNISEEEEARSLEEKRRQEEAAAAAASQGSVTPGGAIGGGLLVLAIAGIAAAVFLLPFSPLRRRSPATAVFYYGRMLRWARLGRLGPAAHQTPFEFSEALSREVRGTSLFTRAIARAYVREKFGGRPLGPAEQATLNKSWDSLRKRLWRKVPVQYLGLVWRRRN